MSRTTRQVLASVALLFAIAVTSAFARTQVISGPCPYGGGTWIIVLTMDDQGHVTDREGIACGGTHWVDHCSVHSLPSDPLASSDYYFVADNGSWWVRCNVNADGSIGSMWGKTSEGAFWKADENQGGASLL